MAKVKALPFSEEELKKFVEQLRDYSQEWWEGFFFGLDTGESGIRAVVEEIVKSLDTLLRMPNQLGSFKNFLVERLIALEEEKEAVRDLSIEDKKARLLTFLENSYNQQKNKIVEELITSTVDDEYKM